jgi:hypothetical protein
MRRELGDEVATKEINSSVDQARAGLFLKKSP